MPTWPTLGAPVKIETHIQSALRPGYTYEPDMGNIEERPRSLRRQRMIQIIYRGMRASDFFILQDFTERELNDGYLSFDFTVPIELHQTVVAASTATPIVLGVLASHPFQTGDWVSVANVNSQANGIHQVTRFDNKQILLDGTSGGPGGNTGTVGLHLPKARVQKINGRLPSPEQLYGPMRDDHGLWTIMYTIEERL